MYQSRFHRHFGRVFRFRLRLNYKSRLIVDAVRKVCDFQHITNRWQWRAPESKSPQSFVDVTEKNNTEEVTWLLKMVYFMMHLDNIPWRNNPLYGYSVTALGVRYDAAGIRRRRRVSRDTLQMI